MTDRPDTTHEAVNHNHYNVLSASVLNEYLGDKARHGDKSSCSSNPPAAQIKPTKRNLALQLAPPNADKRQRMPMVLSAPSPQTVA